MQFMEVKHSKEGNKIVALIDSTGNVREPQNGGDVIIPLTLTQYRILSAVHGEVKALGALVDEIQDILKEA